MYYIKINGKIQTQPFSSVSKAKAEIERLREEMSVESWNILTEESAAYEAGIPSRKFKISVTEILIIGAILSLIALGAIALLYRSHHVIKPTHYVVPEMINYRSENGEILGQLEGGTEIICRQIVDRRCLAEVDGRKVYIYLNVLQTKH